MKRRISLTVILFSLLLFCSSAWAVTKTDGITVKGFYDTADTGVSLYIWKGAIPNGGSRSDADRIFNYGGTEIDNTSGVTLNSEITVFNWRISGSSGTGMSLSFSISPLQAYMDGLYYIPKYNIRMYDDSNNFITPKEKQYSRNPQSGNRPYPGYGNMTNNNTNWIVENAVFEYENDDLNSNWELNGYCTLMIVAYESSVAGSFEYSSTVTVEFEVI